ncbi:hypothetical protein PHJA_001844600 [Phtheirospermum japonicum]|uniref:Secreted protein n=1 Tax=Phtheirospermum japonicum TaxID=374723 RepID=A0A830CPN9_9LAMI|nr:hypothetical protein PHJA_001844600 [Phtheirospermum japonicum]
MRRRLITLMMMQVVLVQCQQQVLEDDYNGINATQLNDPTLLNHFTQMVYQRLSAVTSDLIHSEIAHKATFCGRRLEQVF